MNRRFIVTLIGILLVYGGLSLYLGWNGWVYLSAVYEWNHAGLYSAVVALLALAFIIGRAGQATLIRPIAGPLKLIGSYWFAILEYGVLLFPLADVVALLLKLGGAERDAYVIGTGSVTSIVLLLLLIVGTRNAWSPVIRRYTVQIPKRAGGREKLRIAMASDIHLGTTIGNGHLHRLLQKVKQINPDIILLPGDILDDDIEPFIRRKMAETLGKLEAPLGIYAVTGNHEYIGGKVPEFIAAMDAIGIRVLMDETALVADSFYIIGRKDRASGGFRAGGAGRLPISELVAPLDTSLPMIMLDHQPSDLKNAAENGIDLSLSGHTHRGQMTPNHLITKRLFELDWGYLKKGGLHAIVSSGFGFWGPPVRIGSRSEVLQIDVEFVPV
ncbi:metallophosphoesterase [Paenibacillus harenae]|uniref:MPP superfamily phosphohydrolase n=1 Tax=Paenibacillus harenae TaxID=306543 RepID=A0ABT9U8N4_PAEHA|nr:metallophosphoesterase [Paenibacillus harenae]MDQ0115358.1 putative MPP superfamily phosphohydrolase [Paenibacillus harenae]